MNLDLIFTVTLVGTGATAVMDLYAHILSKYFGVSSLNYALVGRWLLLMPKGHFYHKNIGMVPQVRGEMLLGWSMHYFIGIIFAVFLTLLLGHEWLQNPPLLAILLFALVTVLLPFCVMQPCFGLGIAAANLPNAMIARLKSIAAHFVFGVGLYACALVASLI